MAERTLVERLRSTRDGHAERIEAERLYLDAYAGTGGFQGRAHLPTSSFWGWAADAYSSQPETRLDQRYDRDTYLDRHPREDAKKFERRRQVVHYENHVAACVDIPLSYLRRKPLTRTGVSPAVDAWMTDADGCETTWHDLLMSTILLRGAVTGACPVFFDMPPAVAPEGGERTRAQDLAEGRTVRAIPLFGCNVLDWAEDDRGRFSWAKIAWERRLQPDALGEAVCETEVRILYPDRIELYRIRKDAEGREQATGPETYANPFGEVPLVVFRPKKLGDDPVHGIALVHDIASEARRLFNLHSELDEHIRGSVFAFLQYPTKGGKEKGEITIGAGSALAIDPESKIPFAWIAPPESVAKTLEERITKTIGAIYAMARLAFSQGQAVTAAASGLSRAYEFESTNRAIADTALTLASFDQAALDLVAHLVDPAYETNDEEIRTTAAKSFDVEELDKELATLETAARNRLGPTTMAELRKRTARQLLPNITKDLETRIDEEIDALAGTEATALVQGDAFGSDPGPGKGDATDTAVDTKADTATPAASASA
jgi:hypothetical protein